MKFEFNFLPPSVNSMFYTDFAHKTRHKSAKYRQFQKDLLQFLPTEPIRGEVEIEMNFYFDTLRKNDLDNRIKPILDTLVEYDVIEDDSKVRRIVAEKYYSKRSPATVIEIKPFNPTL